MMIREGRGGDEVSMEEFERRRRGMVQPSQQHIAPCVKALSRDWARHVWGVKQAMSILLGREI